MYVYSVFTTMTPLQLINTATSYSLGISSLSPLLCVITSILQFQHSHSLICNLFSQDTSEISTGDQSTMSSEVEGQEHSG